MIRATPLVGAAAARVGGSAVALEGSGHQVRNAFGDRDGVVADAFVEAGQHGELHGGRQVDAVRSVEDGGDELALEVIEEVVHVGDRRGPARRR